MNRTCALLLHFCTTNFCCMVLRYLPLFTAFGGWYTAQKGWQFSYWDNEMKYHLYDTVLNHDVVRLVIKWCFIKYITLHTFYNPQKIMISCRLTDLFSKQCQLCYLRVGIKKSAHDVEWAIRVEWAKKKKKKGKKKKKLKKKIPHKKSRLYFLINRLVPHSHK